MRAKSLLDSVWLGIRKNDLQQAISSCNQLNKAFPEFAPGWFAASRLAQLINKPDIALKTIDRALALEPGKTDWQLHRAACLIVQGQASDAEESVKLLVGSTKLPGITDSTELTQLAFLCSRLEMHDEAEQIYQTLILREPGNGGHWYNLATIQRFKGAMTEAEASLDKAISLNPSDYEARELRSDLRTQTVQSNHVAELEGLLAQGITMPAGEVKICYALAKELADIGETGRSFKTLRRGANLRRKHLNYTLDGDLQTMEAIQGAFDLKLFENQARGDDSNEAIFIVGLPRTGTTLAERILGSHSAVFAAGELNNFALQMMQQLSVQFAGQTISRPDLVKKSADLDFARLGQAYIRSTRPRTGHTPHFVDKMPLNFLYTGLIHLALPRAKIIHLTRQPMDTCYAIYKRLFQDAYPWSYDLEEIAGYYLAYRRLMAHWKSVLPGVIHELAYEDLVRDLEGEARKLTDLLDLPWESQCVRFYEGAAISTTASASQLRQPVYNSSVGLWKQYAQELAPVASKLRESGIAIDY